MFFMYFNQPCVLWVSIKYVFFICLCQTNVFPLVTASASTHMESNVLYVFQLNTCFSGVSVKLVSMCLAMHHKNL